MKKAILTFSLLFPVVSFAQSTKTYFATRYSLSQHSAIVNSKLVLFDDGRFDIEFVAAINMPHITGTYKYVSADKSTNIDNADKLELNVSAKDFSGKTQKMILIAGTAYGMKTFRDDTVCYYYDSSKS